MFVGANPACLTLCTGNQRQSTPHYLSPGTADAWGTVGPQSRMTKCHTFHLPPHSRALTQVLGEDSLVLSPADPEIHSSVSWKRFHSQSPWSFSISTWLHCAFFFLWLLPVPPSGLATPLLTSTFQSFI